MQELYTEEHNLFRESFNTFLKQEALPHYQQWEKDGIIDRSLWKKAADLGILGLNIAEEYPTMLAGNPSRLELVEQYAQKSGRPINHLVFYYAFGLFKNAVIVQQIYYRYAKGLTTNENFANLNQLTKLFCKLAWQAIQNNRIE